MCRRVWVSDSRNPTLLTQSWVCGARSPWGTQAFSCFQVSVRCNNIKVIDVTGWCELTRSEQWRTQSRWCFFSFFLAVKWFQIQHLKEHIGLDFPHHECASLKDKGWQMLLHAKINDSLFKRWISNQPFHHWRLPPLFHLHPESSGGETKQNRSICHGSEAKMNTFKERSEQLLPNECNGKEIL